ncbi:GPCR, family 3 domain-containing protein [Rozella allomycis CSF55]|uniref:GPCR, family 3 domain-containing protein n=1 Tax=Rozella allomycis (strain CSF55) TaxID=988480 RepID=A0A075AP07_ROZAC|nr:GPCR, family 3 domain-containing protein [Rozella allomycis CSF55]|eukprot:EPZ31654.1 GPCR, family 3 domain-containing protein [Rozella allomycis CSF55]
MRTTILYLLTLSYGFAVNIIGNLKINTKINSVPRDATEIVLGGLFPMTRNSTNAPWIKEAFRCAIDRINKDNSILPNTTLMYNIQDTADNPVSALYSGLQLWEQGLISVIGPSSSVETDAVAKLYSSFKIPLISYASSATSLSDANQYPTLLRTVSSDSVQAKVLVQIAQKLKWTLLAAVFSDDIYGTSGYDAIKKAADAKDIKLGCIMSVKADGSSSTEPVKSCILESKAKVVLLFMNEISAGTIITSMSRRPEFQDITFIASDAWAGFVSVDSFVKGKYSVDFLSGSLGVVPSAGNIDFFRNCFPKLTPQNTNYSAFGGLWENTFNCVLQSDQDPPLPKCDPNLDNRQKGTKNCICTRNEQFNDPPDPKVAYVFDAVYGVANALHYIQYQCDVLRSANFCSLKSITGQNLLMALRELQYFGNTGDIQFDGVNRKGSSYDIVQIDINDVVPDNIDFNNPASIVINVFSSLGILATGYFSYYVIKNRNSKVIRKVNLLFCQMLLFGILLVYVSLFFQSAAPSTMNCNVSVWLPLLGFSFICGPMLGKMFKVWRIFHSCKIKSISITNYELIKFSSSIILFEVIALSIWTLVLGPSTPIVVESTSNSLYTYTVCAKGNSSLDFYLSVSLIACNGLLVLSGVILSFLTRNVDSAYNETRYIGYCMYDFLICCVILLPMYFTSGDQEGSVFRRYLILSLARLFGATFTLLCMFVPKVIHHKAFIRNPLEHELPRLPKMAELRLSIDYDGCTETYVPSKFASPFAILK